MGASHKIACAASATAILFFVACGGDSAPESYAAAPASAPAPGLLLISPLKDQSTYLLDAQGEIAHRWDLDLPPGNSVYLMDDGDLLRCARLGDNPVFHGGGEGGRIQRFSWDGELEWDFLWSDDQHLHHHDIAPLPNGNVLLLSWSAKTKEQVLAAGMDPALLQGDSLWPDSVLEIRPLGADGGEVVWTWNVWDHLVQEFDAESDNYGIVADHPELIDLNAHRHRQQKSEEEQAAELARMTALGYAGDEEPEETPELLFTDAVADEKEAPEKKGKPRRGSKGEDFCHTNGIDYNPQLDQIVLSVRTFSELWVIDHSTTSEEAAGHTGGRSGRGGDLLYRWGNPLNYGRGTVDHQQLFKQHDARWIPEGMPGAGHLTVFNNGSDRPGGEYSSVVEIALPRTADGHYEMLGGEPFGPALATWEFKASEPESFYSSFISGAERQPNGNTLICSGEHGLVFEVNSIGDTVWEYANEFGEQDQPKPDPGADSTAPADKGAGRASNMNPKALFRASRVAPDHPGLSRLEP
ncbi:MAG: hypothetical protein ACI9F9_003299 [Candidatus Paceibacteria bacterium]|jgi:hypothetical protein